MNSTGYIPVEFCKSKVVFIPKPLKDDYGEAGSFRPISLTQFLFKSMECVIEWWLREQADKIGQISDFQHAYSGSKGTDTALSTLVNLIESAILRKQLCLVISVDIQGAFDNLAFMAIKKEKVMKDNNYPPLMIKWYMNFFLNRIAIAEVLGVKLSIRPVCGTPQGGVLSSRIWNLAFEMLKETMETKEIMLKSGAIQSTGMCSGGQVRLTHYKQCYDWLTNYLGYDDKNYLTIADLDIQNGFKMFTALISCTESVKLYQFLHTLISTQSPRTIIQTTINTIQNGKIIKISNKKRFNQFYLMLDKLFHFQLGKILLAISTKFQLKAMKDKDWPYFSQYSQEMDQCLSGETCQGTMDIVQGLGE